MKVIDPIVTDAYQCDYESLGDSSVKEGSPVQTVFKTEDASVAGTGKPAAGVAIEADRQRAPRRVSTERVWRELTRVSFAVVSYVTPSGEPRSSGVVFTISGRHMYVAVAPNSWKARHIALNGRVAVTVPIRRGGLLSLLFPIPPAVVSFHGNAIVHPAGSRDLQVPLQTLDALVPPERRASASIIEIAPVGQFATYGVGVSLSQMRSPALASGRAAVS